MKFNQLIKIDHIQINNDARSKKKALQSISQIVHNNYPELQENTILETLIDRERLGNTSIGHGIALPHVRLSECTEIIAVFLSLSKAINFEAIDKQPVKHLLALFLPTEATDEHQEILAKLTDFFHQETHYQQLDNATSVESVYNILIHI